MRVDATGAGIEARRFRAQAPVGTRRMRSLIAHHAALLETKIKRRVSHTPGDGHVAAITGNYRRSITRELHPTAHGMEADIGTNAVQGPRLEYGFHGTDSLGRRYSQPAYPHFRPAADETDRELGESVAAIIGGPA